MSFSNMDPTSLGAQNQSMMNPMMNPGQEQFIPLSILLESAIQRTYHQLMIMTDMLQATSDKERKIKIVAYSCKTRLLFMRIYALVKFLKSAHINVTNILNFLDQQSFIFVDTADFLFHLAKVKLVNARLPSFSISTAVDVLNSGSYHRLPTCINRIIPSEKVKESELETTYAYLNRTIQCRLALSELPYQLKSFKIEKGCVLFVVKNEFEIKLTLFNDNFKTPWRVISVNFLTKDKQNSNRLDMHGMQKQWIQDIVQQRLNENKRPLVDIYKCLHFLAQSMQLEILFQQMRELNLMNGGRFYQILEYTNWKLLTVKYWLDYSKNQYDFKFTIFINDNGDFLQTKHYPVLSWRDHKNVDEILKTDELYIEKVMNSIIKFRSKKRLAEMQTYLANIKFCDSCVIEQKPAIRIQFFDLQLKNEAVWISIDYYTGLFRCLVQGSGTNDDLQLKANMEECLNSDLKNLEGLLQRMRISLIIKHLKLIATHSGFKSYENLSLIHFCDADVSAEFAKIEKNRLFVELNRHDDYLIMITFRTKEDLNNSEEIDWYDNVELVENDNYIKQNIYLLHFDKCKFDGENDPTKPFLKLKTITRFNEIISDMEVNLAKNKNKPVLRDPFKRDHLFLKPLNTKLQTTGDYLAYNRSVIISLIDKIFYIEESLPFLNFTHILNKQQVVTQSYKKNPVVLGMNTLNILSEPKQLDLSKQMRKDSADLWNMINSCNIRQKQFKDYFLSAIPVTWFYKSSSFNTSSKFNFSLEISVNKKSGLNLFNKPHDSGADSDLSVFNFAIELKNMDEFYEAIKNEWQSICQMFKLIKELNEAFVKYPEAIKKIDIRCIQFQKLIVSYGPKLIYTIQFEWLKDTKTYDVKLDINSKNTDTKVDKMPFELNLTNPHNLFINEVKSYFYSQTSQAVLNTVQLLNRTLTFAYALNTLINIPKLNAKILINQSFVTFSSFMLVIYTMNHVRLVFHSKYWVDIQMNQSGQLTLRDSFFDNIDAKKETEQLNLLKFLTDFFKLFNTTPDEKPKEEYFFEVENNIMSPHSILEIENILSVLQNEFQPIVNTNSDSSQQQPQSQNPQQQTGNTEDLMNVNSNDNLNGFPNSAFSNGTMKQEVIGSVDGINSLEPVDEMNIDKYVDSNSLDPQQQSVNNAGYDNNNGISKPQDHSFNNFGANSHSNGNNNYNNNNNNPNSNFNSNSQFDNNSFNYNENLGSIENNKISMELDDLQQQPQAKIDTKDLLSNISDTSLLNSNANTNGNINTNGSSNTQWADEKIESKPTYMEGNFTNENAAVLNDENIVFDPSNNNNSN